MSTHFERPLMMKGMGLAQTKKNLIIAFALTATVGVMMKWREYNHRAKSKEYYKNYDIICVFNEMAEKGLFQSCP